MVEILPFANKILQTKPSFFHIYKEIFQENFKAVLMIDKSVAGTIVLEYQRATVEHLGRSIFRDALTGLKNYLKPLLARKYK